MQNLSKQHKTILVGMAVGIFGAIIFGVAVEIADYRHQKEIRDKDWKDFTAICNQVFSLQWAKAMFAGSGHLPDAVSATWSDISPYWSAPGTHPSLTNIAQISICGEKYILNPVEVELPRAMCGFKRGTRISAAYAAVVENLYRIEMIKASSTLSKDYKIWKDETNQAGSQFDDLLATYIVNPPFISPRALLKESIPGYPARTKISLPPH